MMKTRKLLLYFFIAIIYAGSTSAVMMPIGWGPASNSLIEKGSSEIFPAVRGANLQGDNFILPDDLVGQLNIVIIAFKRKQQDDVNTWIEALTDHVKNTPNLELYELPILKKFNILMRLNINNGMRYGIANKASREHTINLYINKESFKSRLLIADEDHIQILLLNKEGKIFWRESGLANSEKIKSLKLRIASLHDSILNLK